jgi:hypothetical protein
MLDAVHSSYLPIHYIVQLFVDFILARKKVFLRPAADVLLVLVNCYCRWSKLKCMLNIVA